MNVKPTVTSVKVLLLPITLVWLAGALQPAQAVTTRWVDENGVTHYSDQVPADQAKHPREQLDAQGIRRKVYEGAKTAEQLARERKLRELRSEQQRLLQEQHDSDTSLLRTYRSEDEIRSVAESKLTTIDSTIALTDSNRKRQQEILDGQQKRAAELERRGEAVPQSLRDAIDATGRQIASHEATIRNLESDKAARNIAMQKDMERFAALMRLRQEPGLAAEWDDARKLIGEPPVVSAVACPPGPVCDQVWSLSRDYLMANTDRPLITETAKILQTASSRDDQDVAIVVVRIAGKNTDTIFLDVRCRNSSAGDALCVSQRITDIRAGFEPFIKAKLGLSTP